MYIKQCISSGFTFFRSLVSLKIFLALKLFIHVYTFRFLHFLYKIILWTKEKVYSCFLFLLLQVWEPPRVRRLKNTSQTWPGIGLSSGIYFSTHSSRAGEPANFFAAPAPDFFPKWLRLLLFFFRAAPAPRGQKTRLLTIGLSLAKYSFPRKLVSKDHNITLTVSLFIYLGL